MRKVLALSMIAGFVTLAIIGQHMSNDAMAIMVGVIFGVAASIPTSLLIALAARGRSVAEPPYRRNDYQPAPPAPQIIVIPGPTSAHLPQQAPYPSAYRWDGIGAPMPAARQWSVVGDEDNDA